MNRKKIIAVLVLAYTTTGCSVQKQWSAMSGSKADATITLSYFRDVFEIVTVSEQQAVELAREKCALWGYGNAQDFGNTSKQCTNRDCTAWRVIKVYQCF